MTYAESILKVLVVGLLLGAGLPAVFAAGLVAYSNGAGNVHTEGTATAPNPVLKYVGIALFVFVGWVIVTGVFWITRGTIIHHFGVDLFPFMPKK
jgi:hypothetical protein